VTFYDITGFQRRGFLQIISMYLTFFILISNHNILMSTINNFRYSKKLSFSLICFVNLNPYRSTRLLEGYNKKIQMNLKLSLEDQIETDEVIELYKANGWSSADKPEKLIPALKNSDSLVTARISGKLVGIGNAISDGSLVVYYPHMLVHPDHKGKGIGRSMMELLQQRYASFHQQMLTADVDAIGFYKSLGFERAGKTVPMWIYAGNEH
jgi:hypothetical protein